MNRKVNHDDLSRRKKILLFKKNNNRKGFTLVEILAVITILAIIVTIAIPSAMSLSKKIKTNLYCNKIELIETAAELYGSDRKDSFDTDISVDGTTYLGRKIHVSDLITTNYLKKDQSDYPYIVDPRDKTSDSLYNLDLVIYNKYNKIYVSFADTVNETCNIEKYSVDLSETQTEDNSQNTIEKQDAVYQAPTAKTLTYTGTAQTLINEGQSETGTMYYKLGNDGEYQTSVPTATDAGEYIVYYKVVSSDSKYNDLEEQSISVTISGLNLVSKITTLAGSDTTNLAYDKTSDNNIRYIGANPDNYICFDTSCSNGKWRVIGVMNNITTAANGTKSLVKIIRAESVGKYVWDDSYNEDYGNGYGVNDWSNASLQTNLNSGTIYTSYIKKYNSFFETVTWNLGGTDSYTNSSNGLASHFYSYERGTNTYSEGKVKWSAKIGLMYPSDYGYATSGGSTTNRATCLAKELYSWYDSNISDCKNNDYLYLKANEWTITASTADSNLAFVVYSTGRIFSNYDVSVNNYYAVRPVGYLISNTKILSGSGTSSSPWIIGV
jgi:prepilin-type N-terminal cleavage/methylation domain-containing protein